MRRFILEVESEDLDVNQEKFVYHFVNLGGWKIFEKQVAAEKGNVNFYIGDWGTFTHLHFCFFIVFWWQKKESLVKALYTFPKFISRCCESYENKTILSKL